MNPLKSLIGKTIKNVDIAGQIDLYKDGECIQEVLKITCTDGSEIFIASDPGDVSGFWTQIYELDKDGINGIEPVMNTAEDIFDENIEDFQKFINKNKKS